MPFVFSFGIAGADPHLDTCLEAFDALCLRNGWSLDVGVVRSEVDRDLLLATIAGGQPVVPAGPGAALSPRLTADDVQEAERIVALIGPEPVMAALDRGVDGVITGRALDIGLFMALPMLRGIPTAVAAFAGKLLECGGLALEPGDSGRCLWASLDETGLEVRSPSADARATVRSLVSHTFYERSHPTQEENPGGLLDLADATYVETPTGIRCEGARWVEAPYTVLMEGARREGFRAVSLLGVREPALLAQARSWADSAEAAVVNAPRFADAVRDGRLRVATRIFGLDAVLGALEPNQAVTGHEAGVLVDVVADTEELAKEAAYFAFIRLFIGPYPGGRPPPATRPRRSCRSSCRCRRCSRSRSTTCCRSPTRWRRSRPRWCGSRAPQRFPRSRRTAMRLSDAADVIRSKNAGPFTVTVDLFFGDEPKYAAARSSSLLTVEGVAAAYAVPVDQVKGVWWDDRIRAAKVSLVRWSSSSDPFCSDLFGAHLHTPLAQAELTPRGAES